jgi:hypothetical protein
MLVQQTETNTSSPDYITFVRRFFTADKTKDSAFACAISANEPNVFAGIDLQGRSAEHFLYAI